MDPAATWCPPPPTHTYTDNTFRLAASRHMPAARPHLLQRRLMSATCHRQSCAPHGRHHQLRPQQVDQHQPATQRHPSSSLWHSAGMAGTGTAQPAALHILLPCTVLQHTTCSCSSCAHLQTTVALTTVVPVLCAQLQQVLCGFCATSGQHPSPHSTSCWLVLRARKTMRSHQTRCTGRVSR
jgi:hypothetical protein